MRDPGMPVERPMTGGTAPGADTEMFDAVVVGGGPSGATAATELARRGRRVAMLDRAGRIKPCGGAIPPALIEEFAIPDELLVARVSEAQMVAPSHRHVRMPIAKGFVGMVDREHFDEWLRKRAALAGTARLTGTYDRVERPEPLEGERAALQVHWHDERGQARTLRARCLIGADGARSRVAQQCVAGADRARYVFAYHEIIESPPQGRAFDGARCDVYYKGEISPDFYGWIFPHGATTSVGSGSAEKGFSVRRGVDALRKDAGLTEAAMIRREGAPIPMVPLPRWDNRRDVVLAGDAAGVVAPASGEGIYYAMAGGRFAAQAADEFLANGDARCLALARKRFMKRHGRVFWVLAIMQRFWYSSDKRRERFVSICADPDVQHLTWEAYLRKRLVRARPLAHVRIFFKDLAHLLGVART
jgi:geranylgeranyl diphosphate/geranylgeranyl-bacteriochlorophyllide a reductase